MNSLRELLWSSSAILWSHFFYYRKAARASLRLAMSFSDKETRLHYLDVAIINYQYAQSTKLATEIDISEVMYNCAVARELYVYELVSFAGKERDIASASKNRTNAETLIYHLVEAFRTFTEAIQLRSAFERSRDNLEINSQASGFVLQAKDHFWNFTETTATIIKTCYLISNPISVIRTIIGKGLRNGKESEVFAKMHLMLFEILFERAKQQMTTDAFAECSGPLGRVKHLCEVHGDSSPRFQQMHSVAVDWEQKLHKELNIAEPRIAIRKGDKWLEEALASTDIEEKVRLGCLAGDEYTKAHSSLQDLPVSSERDEGIAKIKLGIFHYKFSQDPKKARHLLATGLDFVKSASLDSAEQYVIAQAREFLDKIKRDTLKKSDQKSRADHQQVKKLNNIFKDAKSQRDPVSQEIALAELYKTFPPKNGEFIPSEENQQTEQSVKKLYSKAVSHYHPDMNTAAKFGNEWHDLTVEITRILLDNLYPS